MQRGFTQLLILGSVFIISVVSIFAYAAFKNLYYNNKPQAVKQEKTITEKDCNGLQDKTVDEIKWNVFKDLGNNFSTEYPSVLFAEKKGRNLVFSTEQIGKSPIVWLNVYPNPKNMSIVDFWTEDPPNYHSGDIVGDFSQRNENAKSLLKNAEIVYVSKYNFKGFELQIPDVLLRTEIFWVQGDKVFNLGFSPQDQSYGCLGRKKKEIVSHMLRSFEVIKSLEEITKSWTTYESSTFSIKHPEHFYIEQKDSGQTVWRSTFGDYFMALKSSTEPLGEPQINQDFSLAPNDNTIKVLFVNEKKIEIDGKTAQSYSFGCLVDCEYQMVSFNVNGQYYQLIFDVAGGGLSDTFDNILATSKFTNN